MRFRFKFLLLATAFVSGALPISFAHKTAASDAIVTAVAGPMSGDLARFGEQMRHGAEQAVADINAHGGMLGRQVRLVIEDDGCKPDRATSAAEDVANNGAVFVAGHFCSRAKRCKSRSVSFNRLRSAAFSKS